MDGHTVWPNSVRLGLDMKAKTKRDVNMEMAMEMTRHETNMKRFTPASFALHVARYATVSLSILSLLNRCTITQAVHH